jgi:hypothetical protein
MPEDALMAGSYVVCRSDGLRRHDVRTEFHKDWSNRSKFGDGAKQIHRDHGDLKSQLLLSQNKEKGKVIPVIGRGGL